MYCVGDGSTTVKYDPEFNRISDKVDQFMNMDTETLANQMDNLRANGALPMNKMFDYFAKQMGNTSNLINEMKKTMKNMSGLYKKDNK